MLSKKFLKDKSPEDIQKILSEAYMNIRVDEDEMFRPLDWPAEYNSKPEEWITYVMTQPEYFSFFASEILNIDLFPFQCLILRELWNKRFPMLIASRGAGKAESINNLLLTDKGWTKMGDISIGDKIYSRSGKLCNIIDIFPQGKKQVCRLKFSDGRQIDCCEDHLWVMKYQNKDITISTKDLINKTIARKHSNDKYSYIYKLPLCEPIQYDKKDLLLDPYIFGCSLSNVFIPEEYKTSSIEDRMEIVRGLMDVHGSITQSGAIEFTNTCEQLIDDLIDILRSLGISCFKSQSHCFKIYINTSQPIFKLPKKLERIKQKSTVKKKYVSLISAEYVDEYEEMQCISVDSPDHTYITKDYIVTHNTFLLAVYNLFRLTLLPKRKMVLAGAAFRQSKAIFNYMEGIWHNAPLLRDIAASYGSNYGFSKAPEMWTCTIGQSVSVAIPVGYDGGKIRGLRANDLIVDEKNSIPKEIFETVMVPFTAVSSNPIGNAKKEMSIKLAKEYGIELDEHYSEGGYILPNQLVMSGTAGYTYEQFYQDWSDVHDIICSHGDPAKLERYLTKKCQESESSREEILENLNTDDYSIIRIPYKLIPLGFMDAAQVSRSKAMIHSGTYMSEYGSCFADDTSGFFKKSIVDKCTTSPTNIIELEGYESINFEAKIFGDKNRTYIYGIDPASERDNFAIVVLEIHNNHARVVYCWTTNKKQHTEEKAGGFTTEDDYYAYCVIKIRDLMKRFPCQRIMLDAQGGGVSIREGLMNERMIGPGEQKILPVITNKDKDTDLLEGLHILELCNFSSYDWLSEANHGLRFDLERKHLLFPYFDPLTIAISSSLDDAYNRIYDNLEYCVTEIEELKKELVSIVVTRTNNGRDRWDTPDTIASGKKGNMRKDRYSALLMANMGIRQLRNDITFTPQGNYGGFAQKGKSEGKLFEGNQLHAKALTEAYKFL